MKVMKQVIKYKVESWDELSEDRKEQEKQKAIHEDKWYDIFADDMLRQYKEDLAFLQDKYKLNIAPEFSQGSQHFIVKFVCEDIKDNRTALWYKDYQFDVAIDNRKNIEIFVDTDNSLDTEYFKLVNELEEVIKAFLDDFYVMYEYYREHFMYGGCEAYELFMLGMLQEEEFETVISNDVRRLNTKEAQDER